jgi:hypothetical protein
MGGCGEVDEGGGRGGMDGRGGVGWQPKVNQYPVVS